MQNANDAVIEFLLNQLRQQLTNNPYKQQCEDLAHEVQSLKNQLRDASSLVAELQETIKLMGEDFGRVTGRGGHEQSGCRKEDTQECEHEWFRHLDKDYCFKCGVTKPEECEHTHAEYRNHNRELICLSCGKDIGI